MLNVPNNMVVHISKLEIRTIVSVYYLENRSLLYLWTS
ncbi:hypothetical protein SAMN05421766_11146 [Zobellia uliginosa]|uniref:Uncharacterized protein n=1 Tax=Zobellia uliginosa TaxID=143224 RepID=A0ABY1L537_9FLAO|nr:hypothetical protein SAMN05421766_11146 [Zobellia uliginosa]